jgi:hypothetical protein
MMQHVHEQPPPPALINSNVTPALSAVVLRSIAKDPAARYPGATAMALALTHAFNLPIPANLSPTRSTSQHPYYNPLQPSTPQPEMDVRPLAVTTSPPAPYSPVSQNYPKNQGISPANSPIMNNAGKNQIHPPLAPSTKRPRRRNLYVAVVACAILLLLGISTFFAFPKLFSRQTNLGTPTLDTTGSVVGSIVFLHSPNAPATTFDQLKVDINKISPAPTGTTYYAWLETTGSVISVYPHWQLPTSNGSVHNIYPGSPNQSDLFAKSALFLITAEDANNSPIIPNPDPTRHLYYATITHTSPTPPPFEVRRCPSNGASNAANAC